jgi:hypothetical protein
VLHDPAKRARYDHDVHKGPGELGAVNNRSDSASGPPAAGYARSGHASGADRFDPALALRQAVGPSVGEAILELSPSEAALAAMTAVTLMDGLGNIIRLPAGSGTASGSGSPAPAAAHSREDRAATCSSPSKSVRTSQSILAIARLRFYNGLHISFCWSSLRRWPRWQRFAGSRSANFTQSRTR